MLKLFFSWRRSTSGVQPKITPMPSPPLLSVISRFLSHSSSDVEDIYDPPFSSTSKTLLKPPEIQQKKKNKQKKTQPKKVSSITLHTTRKAQDFPVKSELPFDFRYSYSETNPDVNPIGFREPPRFSPFGPNRLDRKWTGTSAPAHEPVDMEKWAQHRKRVLGEPLTEEEIAELVEKYRHSDCSRQINLVMRMSELCLLW